MVHRYTERSIMRSASRVVRRAALAWLLLIAIWPTSVLANGRDAFSFPRPLRLYLFASGANRDVAQQYLNTLCATMKEDARQRKSSSFSAVTLLLVEDKDDLLSLIKSKLGPGANERTIDDLLSLLDGWGRKEPPCLPDGVAAPAGPGGPARVPIGLLRLKVIDLGATARVEVARELVDSRSPDWVSLDIPRNETFGKQPAEVVEAARLLGVKYLGLAEPIPFTMSAHVAPQDRCQLAQQDASCVRLGGELDLTLSIRDGTWVRAREVGVELHEQCVVEHDSSRRVRSERVAPVASPNGGSPMSVRVTVKPAHVGVCEVKLRMGNDSSQETPGHTFQVRPSAVFLEPLSQATPVEEEVKGLNLVERNLLPVLGETTNAAALDRIIARWKTADGSLFVYLTRKARRKLKQIRISALSGSVAKRVEEAISAAIDADGELLGYRLLREDYCAQIQEKVLSGFALEDPPLNEWGELCESAVDAFLDSVGKAATPTSRIVVRRGEPGAQVYSSVESLKKQAAAIVRPADGIFARTFGAQVRPHEKYVLQPLGAHDEQGVPVRVVIENWRASSGLSAGLSFASFVSDRPSAGMTERMEAGLQLRLLDNALVLAVRGAVYGVAHPRAIGARFEVEARPSFWCAAIAWQPMVLSRDFAFKTLVCDRFRVYFGSVGYAVDAALFFPPRQEANPSSFTGWFLSPFSFELMPEAEGPTLGLYSRVYLNSDPQRVPSFELGARLTFETSNAAVFQPALKPTVTPRRRRRWEGGTIY